MAETFGDCNSGEGPTKWNTTILRRATDDELKRARSVLAPLENNHDCYRDGCNGTAGDGGETYHYLHRASSPDQQHQYHDPGSPLADNITTLVTGEDIYTTSSYPTQTNTVPFHAYLCSNTSLLSPYRYQHAIIRMHPPKN